MSVFELEMNGRMFEVEAPSMDAALSAFRGQAPQSSYANAPDPTLDIVKSAGIGAVKGTIGLADIPELGARGINWATNRVMGALGLPEKNREDRPLASPQIQAAIEPYTGKFYEPQTPEGQIAERAGGFLPGMIGGPGGLATRAVTNVAAPFLASEGAHALTAGIGYEPLAGVAAALVAPSASGRAMGVRPALPATKTTADEIKAAATAVYNDPAVMGRSVPANTVGRAADMIAADIATDIKPRNAPQTFAALRDMKAGTATPTPQFQMQGLAGAGYTAPRPPPPLTLADIDSVRRNLKEVQKSNTSKIDGPNTEAAAATRAIKRLDQLEAILSPEIKVAQKNYAVFKESKALTKAIDKVERQAKTRNSGANVGNMIRTKVDDLRAKGFHAPEVLAQMDRVSGGPGGVNAIRLMANLLGGGGGLGMLASGGAGAGIGAAALGPLGLLLAPAAMAAGKGLKTIENRNVRKSVKELDALIRSRAPAAKKVSELPASVREIMARLLLAAPAAQAGR